MEWYLHQKTHAAATAMVQRMGSAIAGGSEPWIVNRMSQIDQHVGAARREIEAVLRGRDAGDLDETEKKPLRALYSAIDHALAVKAELEQQRATPGATGSAPVGALAKRSDVQAAVAEYRDAKDAFDSAVAGKSGRLNFSEEQRIRTRLSAAEIRVQKFL